MSKYTEAEVINAIRTMGLFRTNYPKKEIEKVVLDALEKQIPKKPIPIDDGWRYWDCPNCGLRVGSNMDFKYWTCMCGQRIDWSDTE